MSLTATPVRRRVDHVMGLPVSVALRGRHEEGPAADVAWAGVLADLREADRIFSTYRDDSFVSRLDRGEVVAADGPPEVAHVLALGERARQESGGAFDVVRDGRLDPSGVVKGWAAERASRHLALLDDTDYCLSAGGDITCRAAAHAEPWRIGIEDPRDPTRVLAVVPLRTGAVATSGTAHRGAHLVDARTGRVPSGVASVTVIGRSLTWADIDATAAYAQGEQAAAWLRTRPIESALVVTPDGRAATVVPDPPAFSRV
jgi:thiamine biosynthesis lipoprotein